MCVSMGGRENERGNERIYLCACKIERESMCVVERKGESERKRDRRRENVCVFIKKTPHGLMGDKVNF